MKENNYTIQNSCYNCAHSKITRFLICDLNNNYPVNDGKSSFMDYINESRIYEEKNRVAHNGICDMYLSDNKK